LRELIKLRSTGPEKPETTVTAVRDLKMTKGSAGSHAFECDDGQRYFVKFKDATRTVTNEYIGYSLASWLDLPVPENGKVMVPQKLIDDSEDLHRRAIVGGVHHGTVWMDGCVDFKDRVVRELDLTNSACLPGLVVLDNLVVNMDRNNPGNNLIQTTPRGLEYKTVDFSEILSGRSWTVETMAVAKTYRHLVPVFTVLALPVTGILSFSPWLERVEALSDAEVANMLSGIPDSWQVTDVEKKAIADFLLGRKVLVREILLLNRSRFLHWR
jgi:hypothetical protein